MATINFFLKGGENAPASKPASIIMTFSYKGNRARIYTGEMIEPRKWSFTKKRAHSTAAGSAALNELLKSLGEQLQDVYRRLSAEGATPTVSELVTAFEEERNAKLNSPFVIDAYRTFLEGIESGQILHPKKGTRYSRNTTKSYRMNLGRLEEYQSRRKRQLTFEDITGKFERAFKNHLTTGKNLSLNSIGTAIKCLKAVLNYSVEMGWTEKTDFRKFKVEKEEADSIYLNPEELHALLILDLSQNTRLDRVRDLFLVGCWTGLRFSDLSRLTSNNIQGNTIKIPTRKTGATVTIPIHPVVREILKKYDGALPASISNQKFNDYIKEIGMRAGINQPVVTTITRGGEKEENEHPKYQLISTHTARRSFCTNMYKTGVPVNTLMKISGHKTESAFLRYIKISEEEAAELLAQSPLFRVNIEKTGKFEVA